MIPGLNLSSYIYLTTPDGRDGWAQRFAEAGYEVYVINDPRFDFSHGFNAPGFESVPTKGARPANPDAQQGWQRDIWRRWGFGPSEGNPYPDSQFPSEEFETFEKNYPHLSSANSSFGQAITALLEQTGPAILMAHSAGGPKALSAARAHPELVAGLVLIEPTGPPTEADFPTLSGISMLGVYGDYIASRRQTRRKAGVEAAALLFEQNGGAGKVISLPDDHNVNGNSHLMMQGQNNDFIASLIIDWLRTNAKTPPLGARDAGNGDAPDSKPERGDDRGDRGDAGATNRLFSMLDSDKNGRLSLEEFGQGRRYQNASASEVRDAFEKADANNDGSVTAEELATGTGRDRSGRSGRNGNDGR